MSKVKYYAVKKGRIPGVYMTWDECQEQVKGFSGAEFKSFSTAEEALSYVELAPGIIAVGEMKEEDNTIDTLFNDITTVHTNTVYPQDVLLKNKNYVFVDGSYNDANKTYGWGGFLRTDEQEYIIQGSGQNEEYVGMRNVAGEILGCTKAIEKAIDLGLSSLIVLYDYEGIEKWANGSWKTNKIGTVAYKEFINRAKTKIDIEFQKVKAHSGIEGNERADKLAKEAVGIL